MTTFNNINKKLILTNGFCEFFIKFTKLLFLLIFLLIVNNTIKNLSNNVRIDNKKTVIINPIVQTGGNNNYILISEKGTFIGNNTYKFENVQILNNNINIFTKELDFYSDRNEIIMVDRPIIIFNNNKE
jgi:hypothetical protein